jgi:hypothetical protein
MGAKARMLRKLINHLLTGKENFMKPAQIRIVLSIALLMIFCSCVKDTKAQEPADEQQILVNPDFSLPLVDGNPPGWFKAMMPDLTQGLDAGVARDEKGPYVYLSQKGVQGQLFNNWAQRIENPPAGEKMRLEAEVSTQGAASKGGIILLMFFDKEGRTLAAASSENAYNLSGSKPWSKITMTALVPRNCDLAIVRIGLNPGAGKIMARYAKLYLSGQPRTKNAEAVRDSNTQQTQAGIELLINGDFESDLVLGDPPGWFRAMIPAKTVNLKAGIEKIEGHGNTAFIEQDGVKVNLVNNWAQRLETIPVGATLRLTADVKTKDLPENTGFVMIQCWGKDEKLLAAATTQSSQPIGGTEDWKKVSIEVTVPQETTIIIVRCGLSQSGKIWFDNVSLKIISPGKSAQAGNTNAFAEGFKVTEESMTQLNKITSLSDKLIDYASEQLGDAVEIRKEVFAHGEGKYEVVLYFSFTEGGKS